jgi:hypothetical protein
MTEPAGTPISRALPVWRLDLDPGGRVDKVEQAIAAIDRVHGDGDLPPLPVEQFAVGLHLGEHFGDVVADPPLTKEEYRRMGLNRDFLFDRAPELAAPTEDAAEKRRRP